jgi:excisionase family DNA binding protein
MTKAEAAEYLGCSVRQLERYTSENRIGVRMEKGRTRPTPVYDEGELEAFKSSLERVVFRPAVQRLETLQNSTENAIATQGDGGLSVMSQAGANASQMEAFARFIVEAVQAQKPEASAPSLSDLSAKLLLTLPEAQALTGLSRDVLRAAIDDGSLSARRIGRAFRIKRADLESYIEIL